MSGIIQKIKLVKGIFSPFEAADVLLQLISDKIKFHNLQLLNMNKVYDDGINPSEQRIRALKEAKNLTKDLILKARDDGYEIKINSTIEIELIKSDTSN